MIPRRLVTSIKYLSTGSCNTDTNPNALPPHAPLLRCARFRSPWIVESKAWRRRFTQIDQSDKRVLGWGKSKYSEKFCPLEPKYDKDPYPQCHPALLLTGLRSVLLRILNLRRTMVLEDLTTFPQVLGLRMCIRD